VTEPTDALRGVLRDLIPDYTGPEDPLPRVVASVRRRRVRQRALLAAGAVGVVAAVAVTVPAVLAVTGAPAGTRAAAGPSAGPDRPRPEPPVYPVSSGEVRGVAWAVGSTALEAGSRRCLVSDDLIFDRDTVCFESWKAGSPVTWAAEQVPGPGVTVTRVAGVAPAGAAAVRVRLADGTVLTTPTRQTPTDPRARFFGLVAEGAREVGDVTVLDGTGRPLGAPVTDPGPTGCAPSPVAACADPK
jgi:hypothetical protein